MSVSVTVEWGDPLRGVAGRVECWVDSDDDVRQVLFVLESRRSDPPGASCCPCQPKDHGDATCQRSCHPQADAS